MLDGKPNRKLFDFTIPLPKGKGGKKNAIASINEVAKWHWNMVSKVKTEYKDLIKQWYLEENSGNKYRTMLIVFKLKRHNRRILDSDNLGFIIKWTIDAIKEQQWLTDDDQVYYLVEPAVLNTDLIESSIEVECYI